MSTNHITTKVCIIGAGSAGLLIANILHKHRIPCVVVEKYSEAKIYARSRADLVDHQSVTVLQKHGLSDRLLKEGVPHGKCEFRTPKQSFILDYAQKCQGQTHYTYPQQELLKDLIKKFELAGGRILFNTQGIDINNSDRGVKVECQQNGHTITIDCDFIAGCDGFHGVSRASIPETITQPRNKDFDYAWLAITAEAPPSTEHIIYGLHPNGFAGHMLRDETISRYYLQIPLEDKITDWSNSRVWSELQLRLAKDDWKLAEGKITAKQILNMRSFAVQTMQHCRLFLAGDAAHTMTPAGGKGMNLAIQDADVLGNSFVSYYRYHDNLPLKNYSANRLPVVRKTLEFSESLLHMINVQDDRTEAGKSQQRVQQFKRSQLINSEIYALDFARKYVGYIKSDRSITKSPTPEKTADVLKFNPAKLPPLKVG